jgi:hypothetical protein
MNAATKQSNEGPQTMREIHFLIGSCVWSAMERDGLARGKRPDYRGIVNVGAAVWPQVESKFRSKGKR